MADFAAILCQVSQASTPSTSTQPTVLAANVNRAGFIIQNQGTFPLFIAFGQGATNSVYHLILQGGTANADGKGGILNSTTGAIYQGIITSAGTNPTYTVLEL